MELLLVCLAAHDSEFRRWPDGVDRRICQTFAASPAEPGELPLGFSTGYKYAHWAQTEKYIADDREHAKGYHAKRCEHGDGSAPTGHIGPRHVRPASQAQLTAAEMALNGVRRVPSICITSPLHRRAGNSLGRAHYREVTSPHGGADSNPSGPPLPSGDPAVGSTP